MSVLREKPPMPKNRIHKMGSALREGGVGVTPDDWEAYLLHQTEIVGELVKQLGDFAESNSEVLLGGETMEKNIVPGSGAYMVSGRPKTIISLKEKLRHRQETPLERIQDVAGTRLDCDVTLTQQRRIVDELCDLFTECGATRVDIKDLRDGSHSGYRAIHLHLNFLRVLLKYRCGQRYNRIGRMFMNALLISSVGISGIYMKILIRDHCRRKKR